MNDPYATLREQVLHSVLDGPAHTDAALRRAAAADGDVGAALQPLVGKIHRHAFTVTDEDLAGLQSRHDDDALFELVVSAALGASERRLAAGLRALEEA